VVWGDGTASGPVTTGSPCSVPHTYAAGSYTATVTVRDDDGGEATATVAVSVAPGLAFDGFYQPVDNLPARNTVQAGRAIPVKFSLGGDHGLGIFAPGYPASAPVACATGALLDEVEETSTAGSSSLTYDPTTGRYHYVWKTEKAWKGQCRILVVRFVDGTEATALFSFR
jgi:hypothetical protein